MTDFNGPNYPPPPGPSYKQPSKLGQFILDPRTSVKNYITDALTEPGRPPPAGSYVGGPPPINQYQNSRPPSSGPPLEAPLPLRPAKHQQQPHSPPHIAQDLSSLFPPPGTSGSPSGPSLRPNSRPPSPGQEQRPPQGQELRPPQGQEQRPPHSFKPPHRGDSASSLQTPDNMDGPGVRPPSRLSYPDQSMPGNFRAASPQPSPQPQGPGYGQIGGPPPQQMNFHNSLAPPGDMALPRNMGDMTQMGQMNGMNQMGQMGQMNMGMPMMGNRPQSQIMTVATMNQGAPAPKAFHRMINDYNTLKMGYYMAHIQSESGDLTQVIARLRLLAREIWSLRHRRATEFEGSETHAEAVITFWKSEFDFWSDIFEDSYDPVQQQISSMIKQQNQYAALCGLEEAASAGGDKETTEKPKKKKKAADVLKKKSVMFKPGDEEQY